MGRREFPQPTRLRQVGRIHPLPETNIDALAAIIKNRLRDEAGNSPPEDLAEAIISQLTLPDSFGAESEVLKSQVDNLPVKQALREIRKSRGLTPATPGQLVSLMSDILHCEKGARIHALGATITIGRKRYYLTAGLPAKPVRQKTGRGPLRPFLTLTRVADIKSAQGLGKVDRFLVVKHKRQATH